MSEPFHTSRRAAETALRHGQRPTRRAADFHPYAASVFAVAAALASALLIGPVVGTENVDLIFLVFVIGVAIRFGLGPSLAASILSVFAYNFFFMTPVHSLEVADPANVAALFFFMAVALVTSHLAARARTQAIAARRRAEVTEALYGFSRRLSELVELDNLIEATVDQVSSTLSLESVLVLREADGQVQVRMSDPLAGPMNPVDLAAVQAGWSHPPEGGKGRDARRIGERLFFPLRTSNGVLGAIGIAREWRHYPLAVEEHQLLGALADQAAVAIERVRLAAERDEARLGAERERLRSTLLASLSHDLKTPLASIIGAITSLRQYGDLYDVSARDDLATTIQDEAERLARFVANLLDMARLEAGGVTPNLEPIDLGDMVGSALERTETLLRGFEVDVAIDPDLPMLRLDPVLFEQVLVNLLDNASKYAPPGSVIAIEGRREDDSVVLEIADEGPGLPKDTERVFEKFYRSETGDRRRPGTGLGLAICRGFVEALGGTITAATRAATSGAKFVIAFPSTAFAAAPQEGTSP